MYYAKNKWTNHILFYSYLTNNEKKTWAQSALTSVSYQAILGQADYASDMLFMLLPIYNDPLTWISILADS